MNNTTAKLADAAWRNGRECAEVAFLNNPPPWTELEEVAVLEQMAEALIASFPGGAAAYARHVRLISLQAREGFDERLRELVAGASTENGARPC